MSLLFRTLHTSNFYTAFHTQAATIIGCGSGTWADIGCGPWYLTRAAAKLGYSATGFDISPNMIADAQSLTHENEAHFITGGFDDIPNGAYDIVSASSLVVVTPDHAQTLDILIQKTKPQGTVICIEACPKMGYRRAFQWIQDHKPPMIETLLLMLWVTVRRGNTVSPHIFIERGFVETPTLNQMVSIWVRK